MKEIIGNVHMHSRYSDGAKWHAEIADEAIRAGLDFIIVTDHNVWVEGVEGYYESAAGRVLLLVGEEVHDPRRTPQANHFLIFGAEKEMSLYARDPQTLIDETRAAGGWGFIAHPFDPAAPSLGEIELGWHSWDIDGYDGLEIWNYMSNIKGHVDGRLKSLRIALNPEKFVEGPDSRSLEKWDELLNMGRRIAAIGGSDAHAFRLSMGPLTRTIFPYEFLFRALNMHLLLPHDLNGELHHDKRLILKALGKGNSWIGYDMASSTKGFRFSGQSRTKGIMGDDIKIGAGATLQIVTPEKCRIRLLNNGRLVKECQNDKNLTHLSSEPGAYRVECSLPYLGKERGWIYSNPIYLV